MDDSTEQGDCCPISQDEMETKGFSFGPRQVRPDNFDAYVDKESARARARMLGCIGIRQYSSTTGGTVWMPCSNESDYRKVTGQDVSSRRRRRRMVKAAFPDDVKTKALGATVGFVDGNVNLNPFTAIDADLDGLVLEGLPMINMGRGIPDPTPGSNLIQSLVPDSPNLPSAEIPGGKPRRTMERMPRPSSLEIGPTVRRPSIRRRTGRVRDQVINVPDAETIAGPSPSDAARAVPIDEVIRRVRAATGFGEPDTRKPQKTPRDLVDEDLITRNRLDLIGIPTGILDVFDASRISAPTSSDGAAARLIAAGGADGLGSLNASLLHQALSNQSSLRNFVAPTGSPYVAQLVALVEEGRLPRVARAILGMSPESVEDFLAVNPRVMITAARSAKKKLRPVGSWATRIDHDPFEVAVHLLRAKDYHLSAIANGSDSPELMNAVDELVGSNASETAAIFSSLVGANRDRLSAAYDGSVSTARSGNKLLMVARDLIANATENDSTWSASRKAVARVSEAMVSGDEAMAAMGNFSFRYGRNYPKRRRKSGDWSPIANKIRDSIQRYKIRYGAPAANSANLARFVDFAYPELLDEAAELIDVFKEKIEFGSLRLDDYASEGWRSRDDMDLALDEFDPMNLESIFDPGKKMGLLKSIGVVLSAAAKIAPTPAEEDSVMNIMDEVALWSLTVLPGYSVPRSVTSHKRGIFPEVSSGGEAGMDAARLVRQDIRESLADEPGSLRPAIGGTPRMRMQRKLMSRTSELLDDALPDDLLGRIENDPEGPVVDIAETFLATAEQFKFDQETIAAFYEDLAEMMNKIVEDLPDESKRPRLASMFTDALEEISYNMDDENTQFFLRTGDIPSRTVGRLARRIIAGDRQPEAGMGAGPDDQIEPTMEPGVAPEPSVAPPPARKRVSDADTVMLYDEVLRLVRSLENPNAAYNPDDLDSWREKVRAAGANIPFADVDGLKDVADTTFPAASGGQPPVFRNPFAGVSTDAVESIDDILDIVLDEVGVGAGDKTEKVVSNLKRLMGVRDSADFHSLVRSLSAKNGLASGADISEQLMGNSYLTDSAIRNKVTGRFPDFYDMIDLPKPVDGAEAGMVGPTMDGIRGRVVAERRARELSRVATLSDEGDYAMRAVEVRRRRLLGMAEPGGFLDFITRGVTDQRSPFYMRSAASQMGGLEPYIDRLSDSQINEMWKSVADFVSQARLDMTEGGLNSPYAVMYNAAKMTMALDEPELMAESAENFTDAELLQNLNVNLWEDLLPAEGELTVTPSDIDAVSPVKAKARAALQALALDRGRLIELITGETPAPKTSDRMSGVRGEYIPTPVHMAQLAMADAITPLDSESLVAFVASLNDAQLTSLSAAQILTPEAKELTENELRAISFATVARKLLGVRQLADREPAENRFFGDQVRRVLGDESVSVPVRDLVSAILAKDDSAVSRALAKMEPNEENVASLVNVLWEMGRNSQGTFIVPLLPPKIADAERLTSLRAKAIGVLRSQRDGGRRMARDVIDRFPKEGRGYEMVQVVTEPADGQAAMPNLAELLRTYDGSPDSAAKIIGALSDAQLERLRDNYIIPSILQRMDRQAYEARLEQGPIAQTRAKIDNLGRRMMMLTFGTEGSKRTFDDVLSRTDEALAGAFGEKILEPSLLTPQERQHYSEIIDYFFSGGSETFDDPAEYGAAARARRIAEAETDGEVLSWGEFRSGALPDSEANFNRYMGIGAEAGMALGDQQGNNENLDLPEETAVALFGKDDYDLIRSGDYTSGDTTVPRISVPEENDYAMKALAAFFRAQEGDVPDEIAIRQRKDGSYSASQLIFQALQNATLDLIRRMPNAPFDFPDGPYVVRDDQNKARANFFLAALKEYLLLHMTLGEDMFPIEDIRHGRDPVRYSFNITRDDFQMSVGDDLLNYKLNYDPGQPNNSIRQDQAGEFTGDPSEHPAVKAIGKSIDQHKRLFPSFHDWLSQANRYSRILGGQHYEKDPSKYGFFITEEVMSDPGSMDLDKVVREVADQFLKIGSDYPLHKQQPRLLQDVEDLGPDPDIVSPFPSLESYPDPNTIANLGISKDKLAKQKKIANSSAKASDVARQSWWGMFTSGNLMDEYEIAAVAKTTDGDNFHPDAILTGLRKWARDNNISDAQFKSLYSAAQAAAKARFNSVALTKINNVLNDIALNSTGGIRGEIHRLDQRLRHLEQHWKMLSVNYQDRIRARIQATYSAWGVLLDSYNRHRDQLFRQSARGEITPQQAVDEIQKFYFTIQPAIYQATNLIADLSRETEASARARAINEIERGEIEERIEEIRAAAKLTGRDAEAGMRLVRGVNNALSHLADDPSGLSDEPAGGMSVGRTRFGIVGTERIQIPDKRVLLSTKEKRLAAEIAKVNEILSRVNVDEMERIPDIRTAMATLRRGKPDRVVPQMRFGSPAEIEQAKSTAVLMMIADAEADATTRKIMGARYKRFSELAINSLPSLTKRIIEDVMVDGIADAMQANGVKEADIDAALVMYAEAIRNAKYFAIFNPVSATARLFGVEPEDVSDAIATETLLSKTSNILRMAQSYASGLSGAYSEASVRRMTDNRFPELRNLGPLYLDSIFTPKGSSDRATQKLNSAISLNNLMRLNPRSIPVAFGVSDDVAQLISASAPPRRILSDMHNPLPFDWNFMTFRDRQTWLGSEEAFNSLGRMGVNDELSKLQKQIEDFGSMDGPYPALARMISGNDTTTGAFGGQLITANGRSPIYASRGLERADMVRNGQNQISALASVVPGISQMSDRALSRFLGAPLEVIAEFRRDGAAVSPTEAERLARAFGRTASEVWPSDIPQSDADAGNFYWLASTWDRSGEVVAAINEGSDPFAAAAEMPNGQFVADKVSELLNDGTIDRFYDQIGLEEITQEDAAAFASSIAPRSRKGVVEILAASGFREQDIIDATGFNPNTVRNSLHELRKQGLLPEVVGSPKWIAKNGDAVMADFSSGVSKRALMKKYGIGAKTLDSILASARGSARMDDAYDSYGGAEAGMANRRLPDNTPMSDGPSANWREDRPTRADGTSVDPELQMPPAIVADPFINPGSPASLGVDGEAKDPERMQMLGRVISLWTSFALEGGYLDNTTGDETTHDAIFGSTRDHLDDLASEDVDIGMLGDVAQGDAGKMRAKRFRNFDIATRQENSTFPLFGFDTVPSVIRGEFLGTGLYRGIMPMLRGMLQAIYDKWFRRLSPDSDRISSESVEVGTDTLIEGVASGILPAPEIPEDVNDELRLKLWQMKQIMRNPNLVDAPPMFEPGDEKVMRLLIPMMAATDERNLLRSKFGATPTGTIDQPSDQIAPSTTEGTMAWEAGSNTDLPLLQGVPMFSNLLLGSVLEGNAEAKKIVDNLTPRQIMMANWVYGMYTAVEPMVDAFGSIMPKNPYITASPNIPEEPGSERMLGDPLYIPTREMDDQVFAFTFDSLFKALQEVAEQPGLLLMEALPTEAWSSLYPSSGGEAARQATQMIESTKILARILADVLATSIYRKAVQSIAARDKRKISPFHTPLTTSSDPFGDNDTDWFRFARPRVDSYGYWSMYGPNIVYSGPDGNPYLPGWNDETNPITEPGAASSALTPEALAAERESLRELQRVIDETPGKYWWETASAYGELGDDQILEMHPEEFADYVSSMIAFEDAALVEEKPSQLLKRAFGRLLGMGYPVAELDRFDEWIGPIIKGIPAGTVTKDAVLRQLKNIFPWLDLDRMDDIYPVTGKSFSESINAMKEMFITSPLEVITMFGGKPHLTLAHTILSRPDGPESNDFRNNFMIPLIKGILQTHRSNMEIGYRQVAAFKNGLDTMRVGIGMRQTDFQTQMYVIEQLLNTLRESGSINDETHLKLAEEVARAHVHSLFGDLEFGQTVVEKIHDDQDGWVTFLGIIARHTGADGADDVRQLTPEQSEFLTRYNRYYAEAQDTLGTLFEQHIRSGIYGSVKTLGEAVREMEPFILATERARKRRILLPRYKREMIDPIKDSLLSDDERFAKLLTFNEWLDANGFPELTYDRGDRGTGAEAGMSALTRMVMARFTNDTVFSIVEAYEDAAKSGSPDVNAGHLLLGAWRYVMTHPETGTYLTALRRLNISVENMINALQGVTTPKDGPSPKPTKWTKAAHRALIGALKASSQRGNEFIDLGDLILAILNDRLRGNENDDGVKQALRSKNISPDVIEATIATARVLSGMPLSPEAGMSPSRARTNSTDRSDDLKRNKLLANGMWFNSDRRISVAVGTATDGELVDEVERLMDIYSLMAASNEISPVDFRGGESPFSADAVRPTNSRLIFGDNGQEPADLLGAIRHAMDRADAMVTDNSEQTRLTKLKSSMRLYFDNDEHMPDETDDAEAGMARNFADMIEPIVGNFARSEEVDQRRYFEGVYGDVDMSESELRKVADNISMGSPFNIFHNLDYTEDDINWSTSNWSFNKDAIYVEGADSVMIRMRDLDLRTAEIAMITRKSGPYRNALALVGGLKDDGEDLMTTATRETFEEVGVSLENALQADYLGAMEAPDWDPRFVNGVRVGAGMFVVPWDTQLVAASDASGARWVPLSEIAAGQHRLAFGHAEWIRRAVANLQNDPSSDPYGDLSLSINRRLGMLARAARVRNQKMIAQINDIRRATGRKLFLGSNKMPHPLMPWGNRVAASTWRFGPGAEAGMSDKPIDDSLPRELGLLSVQSKMPPSHLEKGSDTAGFYRVGTSRGGDDLFAAWGDKDRVEQLWRPYVELSLERARRGDIPNDQQRPTAYILGGGSGTGKSTARNMGLAGIPNYDSAIVADPDDAKIMMPETRLWYARRLESASGLVHRESRQVAAVMARAATEEGLDLVYDTSGQFNDGFQDLVDWRKKGYNIVGHYFFAPLPVIQKRVLNREDQFGRHVPEGIVEQIQWNLQQILPIIIERQLFDELYIWDSEKDPTKPLLVGQMLLGQLGAPQILQIKHPYLLRYLYKDRTAPDGSKIEVRKTQTITIPFSGR